MLDASIDQLRTGLESQNIQVDKLSVVVAGGGGGEFERSASYLRDHSGKGKKNAGGRDTLEQVDETMPDPAAPFWSRQGIINADAVDIFA
jgi:hypothetical protein